jgi:hypothetical protein
MWKSQTTKLVLGMCEASAAKTDFHRLHLERHFANAISEVIVPFMRSSLVGHSEALIQIIHQAVEMDKILSKQTSGYAWAFSPDNIEAPFNFSPALEAIMKLHAGDNYPWNSPKGNSQAKVYLVVAPGLRQQGEDNSPVALSEKEAWVVSMEVTCVRPRPQRKFILDGNDSHATMEEK